MNGTYGNSEPVCTIYTDEYAELIEMEHDLIKLKNKLKGSN